MVKTAVIGAAGYAGGELLRLLSNHPLVESVAAQSESQAGRRVSEVHSDLFPLNLTFSEKCPNNTDVVFICKGHGESRKVLESGIIPQAARVIDLSQDFRHEASSLATGRKFIYGLPEVNRKAIATAENIANPGCFATGITLALLPLACKGLIHGDVHVSSTTGSTGAGQSLGATSHFSWRNSNHSAYKVFNHQHEKEILETLTAQQPELDDRLYFLPQRGSFTRGIYTAAWLDAPLGLSECEELYQSYYAAHPFTHLVPFEASLKDVVNTNNCFISLTISKKKLVVVSVIDNLLKGAAGQAVQNMNIMHGFYETAGLHLKPSAF